MSLCRAPASAISVCSRIGTATARRLIHGSKLVLLLAILAQSVAPPVLAQARRAPAPAPLNPSNSTQLNFKDADIDSVIGAFGHLLGRTFIIDPRVRGKITLETARPVSKQQAYEMLQSSLRMQGFAIVDTGSLSRVVPEADAKLQSGPVQVQRMPSDGGDRIVTQIFRLNYESATNLVNVLRPLISPNNTITAYPNNNSLVVTDYAANLQRIARIVATLDSPQTSEVEIIPVKNAIATDLAVVLNRMLDDSARGGAPGAAIDPGQRVAILADPRSNSLMVRSGSRTRMLLVKDLLAKLDQPSTTPGNIHVVYLRNAEALRLAQVLRSVLAGDGSSGGGQGALNTQQALQNLQPQQQLGGAQQPGLNPNSPANSPLGQGGQQLAATSFSAGGATIAADPATNSLIVTASEAVYRNIRNVIDKLDARRAQVFIESIIVEISAERAAELGIQWQFLNPINDKTSGVFGGTNLRDGNGSILGATAGGLQNLPANLGQGLNLGYLRGQSTITLGGTTLQLLNLGLLAKALEANAQANILATPNLLTLDNEEARIIIGQNVPFITGQFTGAATGGVVNPFQTIERRDVGTTLRVKPQVSEAGTVKMQIFQEVSSVVDRTLQQGLITNRRAIESNVLVDDGQIVVLGGLLEERVEGTESKVPLLGDIPFLGQAFRYDTRKRTKTNLLVFLRPIVLRNADNSYSVTADRYDYIRQLQGDSRLPRNILLPDFNPPALPPMPAAPAPKPQAAPSSSSSTPGVTPAAAAPPATNEVYVPLVRQRNGAPAGGTASPPAPAAPAANSAQQPARGEPEPAPAESQRRRNQYVGQ